MSTFPLATIAAQVTADGITAPAYSDILNSLIATFQSIFGSDVLLTADTQEYQWIAVIAKGYHDQNQTAIAVYNSFLPTFAQGVGLSAIVKINGIQRQSPSSSTCTVTITGVGGSVINNGIVQDTAGNLWDLPTTVTIPGGGTIDVVATCQALGAISASISTLTIIFTPTLGWQTVTNAAIASPGNPVETDFALRKRQSISTALPSQSTLQGIAAAVANVVGVVRSIVYENSTGSVDSNGIPGHSIAVVVQGGDSTEIAQVIETKKSPGTGTFGTTSISVSDPSGLPITINFFRLTSVPIFVSLTVRPLAGYTTADNDVIRQAIVDFINNLAIGSTVYYNWLVSIATQLDSSFGQKFNVTGLTSGMSASPVTTADLAIAFNAAATCVLANVVLTIS